MSLLPWDRDAPIVDVGCDIGALVWWLQRRGYQSASGIDVSDELILFARGLAFAA